LHDEALAAEEAGAEAFLEGDADGGAVGGAEEGVFFAKDFTAVVAEFEGDDFAGVGGGEGDAFLPEGARLVKWVMKRDSPVSMRLPTFLSTLMMPPSLGLEPSPILVSKVMTSSM
jgi:hypothetical protein